MSHDESGSGEAGLRRFEILNLLIRRFGYRTYLEIGVAAGETFRAVRIAHKIGVDPRRRLRHFLSRRRKKMTSDEFFRRNRSLFDLVFVDGLHEARQAWKDIDRSLGVLRPGGSLLVHDCLPESKQEQLHPRGQTSWTGDVWRAFLKISQSPGVTTILFDTDHGCGLVRPIPRPAGHPVPPPEIDPFDESLAWEEYDLHRREWLCLVPAEEIVAKIETLPSP